MILFAFLALIGLGCALSLIRWRWGLIILLMVGALQDPVRKMVPGAPGYFTLSTLPVWAAIMFGAFRTGDLNWGRFKGVFPRLSSFSTLFVFALIPAALMSATYSAGSWQITLLGAYAYFSAFSGILIGLFYPSRDGDIERLMIFYVLIVGVMLLGAPMERLGIGTGSGLVGTSRLGHIWVTYRTGGVVHMIAGFYRSPDIMGWHAACLMMLSMILALRRVGWQRLFFAAMTGWGGVALMLCARRKMISGVVLFLVIFLFLFLRHKQARRVFGVAVLSVAALGVWSYFYQLTGSDKEVESFYSTTFSEAGERLHQHAVESPLVTIRQAGMFGYGLGMSVQGAHHIKVKRPHIWQEGGLPKMLVEVGVPGVVAFVLLLFAFSREGLSVLRWIAGFPHAVIYFGLAALLVSNLVSAVISAQVYGDPFIGTLLPFLAGVFFSGARLSANRDASE